MLQRMVLAAAVLMMMSGASAGADLWDLAKANREALTVSTLLTAQDVRDRVNNDLGLRSAIDWCRATGVTHVFIESYRDTYTAPRELLEKARDRFHKEGFEVSGCITPTKVGKLGDGWTSISCYTNAGTQKQLQEIFEYAASMFDEIMIDDFLFIDCRCEECKQARGDQSWQSYRADLMMRMSEQRILGPARKVNPNVKIILKYPQWYDGFHERGYEVVRQSEAFDRTWVGTETRDYDNPQWGGKVQYEAYFIMRWLGGIGGARCGGGWFDPYGTTQDTYVEQARQTVLADAKEMLLFCYGSLLGGTGPANVEKLRTEIPGLFELAKKVRGKTIWGVSAPKVPNSDGANEQYVYDFIGMLGLPLVPADHIDPEAKAIFLPVHSLKDPDLRAKLNAMIQAGTPILMTDGLAKQLGDMDLTAKNITILEVQGDPHRLLKLTREQINAIRDKMLAPLGIRFDAPNKVALYLIGDDVIVIENFNDEPVDVWLDMPAPLSAARTLVLPVGGKADLSCEGRTVRLGGLSPRTMVLMEY